MTIYRHLDTKEKYLLDAEGVSIIQFYTENNLYNKYILTFSNSIHKGTFIPILITINGNKLLIYLFTWNMHLLQMKIVDWRLYSLIPLKRNSQFMRYLFIGY